MPLDHFFDTVAALAAEERMLHLFEAEAAGVVFFPNHEPGAVTEVQEALIVRIVAGADGVGVQVLHQQDVLLHGFQRQGAAERAVVLVAVEAGKEDGFTVEQEAVSFESDGAEAGAVDPVVHHAAAKNKFGAEFIEVWTGGGPGLGGGHGKHGFEEARARGEGLDGEGVGDAGGGEAEDGVLGGAEVFQPGLEAELPGAGGIA